MVSEGKKHQMKVAGIIGLALGFFLSLALWATTSRAIVFGVIPVAVIIAVAQAYIARED